MASPPELDYRTLQTTQSGSYYEEMPIEEPRLTPSRVSSILQQRWKLVMGMVLIVLLLLAAAIVLLLHLMDGGSSENGKIMN